MSVGAITTGDEKLAADLALLSADVLTLDEVAARAGVGPATVLARLEDPDFSKLVEVEIARSKLSGATGQAKATAIRDKALDLLAAKINEDSSARVLLDTLSVVKGITARDDDNKMGAGFQLNIVLSGAAGNESGAATVVDVQAQVVEADQ